MKKSLKAKFFIEWNYFTDGNEKVLKFVQVLLRVAFDGFCKDEWNW